VRGFFICASLCPEVELAMLVRGVGALNLLCWCWVLVRGSSGAHIPEFRFRVRLLCRPSGRLSVPVCYLLPTGF
jgi:hypothetical protein